MTEWLLLLLSLVMVVACGFFVAGEFSFLTVERADVERRAADGDDRSAGVLAALRTLSTQLSTAQVGITITNLAIGYLAEPAIAEIIDGPLTSAGVPEGAVRGVSVTIALVVATAMTMVYGELVPKNLAIARPLATARTVQGFVRTFGRVMAYPIRFLNGTANTFLRRIGIEPQEELASARSPQELASAVARSAEKGTLAGDTADLLQRSLAFGDRRAGDVLTPRLQMSVVERTDPVSKVIELVASTGHSRFPVQGSDLDDIVGAVHVKHAVAVPEDRRHQVSVREVMVPVVVVPATLELDPLLEMLRSGGLQMAVVVDEFGGIDGMVTVEDLIEELIGEVLDEHDRPGAPARRRRDGSWTLSGLLRPDEVAHSASVLLPEHQSYETLGGLMARELGRIPSRGDVVLLTFRVEDGEQQRPAVELTVEAMAGRRVDRVHLRVLGDLPAPVPVTATRAAATP